MAGEIQKEGVIFKGGGKQKGGGNLGGGGGSNHGGHFAYIHKGRHLHPILFLHYFSEWSLF